MKIGKKQKLITWCVIVIILLLILGFAFIEHSRKGLYQEKLNYLSEISDKSAKNIQEEVSGGLSMVAAIATFIGSQVDYNLDHTLSVLAKESENNSFKRMGIIDPAGKAMTTDGYTYDFSDREYFQKAMQGSRTISDCIIDKVDGEEINVLAAPIYQTGEIRGVVFGTKRQSQFSSQIGIESFKGEGCTYIVKSDGSPVVKSDHPLSLGDFENIFDTIATYDVKDKDLQQFKEDTKHGDNGSFEYIRDGERRQICYSKTGVNDWYLVTVVPSLIISAQSNTLIFQMTVIAAVIILLAVFISFIMIRTLQNNNRNLKELAYTDRVTGYSNWTEFNMVTRQLLDDNPQQEFAMVIIDIVKFKVINDMFGHTVGNGVLKFVAEEIDKNLFELETFGRSSSDNFNILMKYESDKRIIQRLGKIASEVQSYMQGYKIEIVAGIYKITDRTLNISELSDRANISKSIAKKKNDISYHIFKEENRLDILYEKEIENMMELGLANGEFEVYLQPKFSIENNEIIGAEALVRWNQGKAGIVPPNDFIPVFEKNGFIRILDIYMFESACRIVRRWMDELPSQLVVPLSVNISRVHLSDMNLPLELSAVARQHNIPTRMLEVELTESAVFMDVDGMKTIMGKIKNEGFKISIDDFGSGYSSLSALKDLPADYVKIDKSFLDESTNDPRGEKMLYSIIEMSKSLGLVSVAEGVETRQQIEMLKNTGCDIVQGYYYSKPVPVRVFEELILKVNKA